METLARYADAVGKRLVVSLGMPDLWASAFVGQGKGWKTIGTELFCREKKRGYF